MDTVQLVLLIVIVVLTLLLVILGIQVFFILKEIRETIARTNRVLETTDNIVQNIAGPVAALSSLSLGSKAASVLAVIKFAKNFMSKDSEEKKKE